MPDLTPDEWRMIDERQNGLEDTADADALPGLHVPRPRRRGSRPPRQLPGPQLNAYEIIFADQAPYHRTPFGFGDLGSWVVGRARAWSDLLFTPEEVAAWLSAGLKADDEEIAQLLRAERIEPKHLGLVIRRQTMLDRLQIQHMSVRQIAELLRREGKMSA